MKRIKWLSIVLLGAMAASATGVKIVGTLTTISGKPLTGATVSLIKAKLSGTTDEDGMFGLYGDVSGVLRANALAGRATIRSDGQCRGFFHRQTWFTCSSLTPSMSKEREFIRPSSEIPFRAFAVWKSNLPGSREETANTYQARD